MFCFVMALKSKRLSKDWSQVCRLFNASLRSAYNQTCGNFKIIVVCHETPDLEQKFDSRVEFINVDFPPPALDPVLTMRDKWAKLAVGMVRAGECRPKFVMNMDADDLVSSRIVEFTESHPDENGWHLSQGYEWGFGRRWIKSVDPFILCGTNAIVGSRLIRFPRDTSPESIENCSVLRWGHTIIAEKLAEADTPLTPLPFRGAVYVTGHGDNWSSCFAMRRLSRIRRGVSWIRHGEWRSLPQLRFCTKSLRNEFSMDARQSAARP